MKLISELFLGMAPSSSAANVTMCVKLRPNDGNTLTQHITTSLGTTCCTRLTTLLRRVATCKALQMELVRIP